jgi:S1-C subfamily serine protease
VTNRPDQIVFFHLLRALLLALLVQCPVQAAEPAGSFERGWEAYDLGDYERAAQLWAPLAEQGHVNAQINLAVMYDHGYGVEQDFDKAALWYRAAAGQDSAIAQYNYGMFLSERHSVDAADGEALDWLRKAAAQGNADAQYQLGIMYAQGRGGAARRADAPQWLYQAGLNYISSEDRSGARSAVQALREMDSGRQLAQELETRLASWIGPLENEEHDSAQSTQSTGTAWPIAPGYAVTNHHVVAGKQSVLLVDTRGREIIARVIASDVNNDIALLSTEQPDSLPPALPLAKSQAGLGASVFTIGFPRVDIMGRTPKLSIGIISSINGLQDDPTSYQISVPIQPGNSGGPLLNMRGEVVGLITSMLGTVNTVNGDTQPVPNINYALKAEHIRSLLQATRQTPVPISELDSGVDSLEALARRIQDSVLLVMAR